MIRCGVALMVNPSLCLGAALARLGTATAASAAGVVRSDASTAKRRRITASLVLLFVPPPPVPAHYRTVAYRHLHQHAVRTRSCGGGAGVDSRAMDPFA